ncbi:LysR substrate-binding domain-containing protein [Yersinia sp. 22-579]|uniref:LysR substrate-binding domain-containing protein n=1 Tax=Yersinia sp. 22-579 TaxID=3057580 RepID=UPI00263B2F04|nr:LysR substrate-binding domain-containing protein [Yersinia sp. 22-579]
MKNFPKINQLKNLRSVIHAGSISSAASATHQTQSSVTRSIQELENTLRVPLLKRGVNGIQLTEFGEFFKPYMDKVLNELERALDDLDEMIYESQGTIKFGCSHLPAYRIMPAVIKKFQQKYPQAELTVIEGQFSELAPLIRSGRLNFYVGITMPDIALDEFHVEHLNESKFYVFSRKNHPLVNSHSLAELKNEKWYLPGGGVNIFNSIEDIIFPYGRGLSSSVLYGDSVSIGEQLILDDDYISIGPKEMLNSFYIKDKLSIIDIKEELPIGCYTIIHGMKRTPLPMTKWFLDEIRYNFMLIKEDN